MLTTAVAGVPNLAFDALLNVRLNVSVDSTRVSFVIDTLKVLVDSPGENVSVPGATS
jgi:hypothetical protein